MRVLLLLLLLGACDMNPVHNTKITEESEGFSANVYRCPAGVPTRGFGTTVKLMPVKITDSDKSVTKEQARIDLRVHMEMYVYPVIRKTVKKPLNLNQYDAIADFIYNVGEGQFRSSTMLKKLNKGDYTGVSNEFGKWIYANGEVFEGLVIRRQKERQLFLTPTEIKATKLTFVQYILEYFK